MWANVMAFVDADGVSVAELHARARTARDLLKGLERWRQRFGAPQVDALRAALQPVEARDTARRLLGDVEARWRARFGRSCVDSLHAALQRLAGGPDDQSPPLFGGLHGQALPPRSGGSPAPEPEPRRLSRSMAR